LDIVITLTVEYDCIGSQRHARLECQVTYQKLDDSIIHSINIVVVVTIFGHHSVKILRIVTFGALQTILPVQTFISHNDPLLIVVGLTINAHVCVRMQCDRWLVGWSLTSLFITDTAISEMSSVINQHSIVCEVNMHGLVAASLR